MATWDQLAQYLVSGLTQGSIYAIVGLGFTIIYSVTGIINFAQGEFVMLGGMLAYTLLAFFKLPVPLAFVLAILLVAGAGYLLNRLAIRPARHASVLSLIIVTIGASVFIRGIAGQAWGKDPFPIPAFSGEEAIPIAGAMVLPQSLWIMGTALAITAVLHVFMGYTMLGKALRACAVNRRAAALVGIDAQTMSMISFSLSGALGAVGGIIIAPVSMTSYDVGLMLGLKGFVAAALGGFTSLIATVVGGIVLGVAEALGAGLISSAYKDAIAIAILFLALFFRAGKGEAG